MHPNTPNTERDILPANVKPIHYDLRLAPDLNNFSFTGTVSIKLAVQDRKCPVIKLNAKDLDISEAKFESFPATSIQHNAEAEETAFTFPEAALARAEGTLHLTFSGPISDKMAGFYRSSYDNPVTGKKEFLAVTQFEPTDARRAFPCWDEPNLKATFSIELEVDAAHVALSNMHPINTTTDEKSGKKKVQFAATPVMSTYLIAFIVGPLDSVETVNKDGIKVRVYAPIGQASQGAFALDCAARTLEFFSEYFDCPYPLQKMDMVAIPDFASGAMENWGLVTYRTVYLLFDPATSTTKSKQNIAYIVGHELAHQWFGNLVTMDWWTDLWLNEGFATWVGTLAANHLFPEWNVWTEFIVDEVAQGLVLDSLRSSHPIEVDVKNPGEINQIFDSISYSKGASVIRMLVGYLGEDDFKRGIRSYLKKHAYSNATTKDLWEALGAASGKPVDEMMTSWTRQVGYPVVELECESCCAWKCTQSRYLSTGKPAAEEDANLWWIPLGLVWEDSADSKSKEASISGVVHVSQQVFHSKSYTFELPKDSTYFKLNNQSMGFFRTLYPASAMQALGKAVEQGKFSPEDRIGLLNDAFSCAFSGHHSLTVPLELLKHFAGETNYFVWMEISLKLSEIRSIWWNEPPAVLKALDTFIQRLTANLLKVLGFDPIPGESDIQGLLRVLIFGLAGRAASPLVLEEAKKRFKRFTKDQDQSAIHPNLRGCLFCICVRVGGQEEFDSVFSIYQQSANPDQKLNALRALGATQDPKIIQQALNLVFDPVNVRPQDIGYILGNVAANPAGRRAAWAFVKGNWTRFYDAFYRGSISLLSRVVSSTTEHFTALADVQDVRAFFGDGKDVSSIIRAIDQSCEKIECAAQVLQRDGAAVGAWLLAQEKAE